MSAFTFAADVLEEVARLMQRPPLVEVSRGVWLREDKQAAFKAAQTKDGNNE